ncbi:3'-5' exoribonuclease [Pararhizobium sp. BT-229]|uniref:3'-5' exonuclease n=1 Tax=Pararhizobium sp. BT-229 TaxID=2986923 RepID=UPI0021F7EE4C|nr:3'-5' exonuclease [Pararhizobium sp. BT-229]MCV9963991.1 3'-5' exoribonuclease [Pararhizobium sp. BT-229]
MAFVTLNQYEMVDTETLGNIPGHSILVIGAVRFDPFMPWPEEGQAIAAKDQFSVRISRESNRKYGLRESEKTLAWWATQSEEARDEAFSGTVDLKDALQMYSDWCFTTFGEDGGRAGEKAADMNTYCHGAEYDVPMIAWAMDHLGVRSPFPYNRTRSTRDVYELAGVEYKGVRHQAIGDCYDQCAALCRSHSILGFSRLANRLPGWLLPYEGLAFPVLI